MRARRWLYVLVGFAAVLLVGVAWYEQANSLLLDDGARVLVGTWIVPLLIGAAVLVLPFALFDFRRWLVGRVSHKRSRWFMSGLIGASFLAGLAIGSNLSICFKESGPPSASASEGAVFTDEVASCWGSGDPMLGLGVGLLAAYTGLVLIWLTLRDQRTMKMSPASSPTA